MALYFIYIIRILMFVLSGYIISQGLFFFIAPIIFDISFKCVSSTELIILNLLVLVNLIGNVSILLTVSVIPFVRVKNIVYPILIVLLAVSLIHIFLSLLRGKLGVDICDEFIRLQGLSMYTIFVLIAYVSYIIYIVKNNMKFGPR